MKIKKIKSPCILWEGCIERNGYGRLKRGGVKYSAHRYIYMLNYGPIPIDMFICHKCDIKNCINIDHLFLGTHKENMADMARKGRRRGGCKRGEEPRGEKCHASKLSEKDVIKIKRMLLSGKITQIELGRMFGVQQAAISKIKRNKTWGHVKIPARD